jgi:hypothetical protein
VYDTSTVPPPLRTIYRDEIRSETKQARSSMLAGYGKMYSPDELKAIIEFLQSGVY